jgi:hypothetical protein
VGELDHLEVAAERHRRGPGGRDVVAARKAAAERSVVRPGGQEPGVEAAGERHRRVALDGLDGRPDRRNGSTIVGERRRVGQPPEAGVAVAVPMVARRGRVRVAEGRRVGRARCRVVGFGQKRVAAEDVPDQRARLEFAG